MISRVQGRLLEAEDGRLEVLTRAGVAYEVHVPLTVLQRLPGKGADVDLRTVLVVRDDSQTLFGFLEERERTLFNRLTTVPKVGAKLAATMMGTYSAGRLAQALTERDVKALTRIVGVGKKTAELAVLHLADKVQDLAVGDAETGPEAARNREAVDALVRLGLSFPDADAAVREVAGGPGGPETAEEVIRQVLARRPSSRSRAAT